MDAIHLTASADETRALGRSFAASLHEGDVVALSGDLGAGKTEFMRGVCAFFGCEEQLSSPTFSLMNIYEGFKDGCPLALHHFDLYRIEDARELASIGFEEYLTAAYCAFVEWAERFGEFEACYTITVLLEEVGPGCRRITIQRIAA